MNGSMLTLSAPPRPAAKAAIPPRITFTQGSRALIMRQALSACTRGASGARPQASPTRAQSRRSARNFDERDELVGVGRHPERDCRAGGLDGNSALLERAQIAQPRGEREGQLLRGRAAGRVDRPSVRGDERPGIPLAAQRRDEICQPSRLRVPRRPASTAGQGADRIEAEAETDRLDAVARARDEPGEALRLILGSRTEIEFEPGAVVEPDAVERAMQGRRIPFAQTMTVGAGSAGEDDLQPIGPAGEILARLGIRVAGFGMIHARQHGPGAGADARRPGGRSASSVERLQRDPVRGFRDERVQRSALQRSLSRPEPFGLGKEREPAGKSFQPVLRTQMNCERPGIAAEISPITSSPAAVRA